MTGYEVTSLVELCRAAGEIAYRYYDDRPQELKQDLSVVTAADRAIEQFLAAEFDRPENGSYLIGEETVGLREEAYLAAALEAEYCWIVDPIDGTAPYATHFPAWGISIGLMRRGVLSDGAIYLPEQDRLLITENELVWEYRGIRAGQPERRPFEFVTPSLESGRPVGIPQRYAKHGEISFSNQVYVWSCCVASFYYLFQGKLLGYLVFAKLWDIAAAMAMLARSNWCIRSTAGRPYALDWRRGDFRLQPGDAHRWELTSPLAIGATEEIVSYLLANVNLPEKQ